MPEIIEIQDLHSPQLHMYAHLNETQLKHYFEPQPEGIFIAESPTVVARALDAGYELLSLLMEKKYLDTQGRPILERCQSFEEKHAASPIPVYVSTLDVLSQITGYHLTRGILGAFRRKKAPTVEAVCRNAHRIAVLDDVENPTNVGAIFRSAAALGMDAVLVTPTCADPLQRRSIRVSVGTVFQIPWTYIGEKMTPAHARAIASRGRESENSAEKPRYSQTDIRDFCARMDHGDAWPGQGIEKLRRMGFFTVAAALRHDTLAVDDPALLQKDRLAVVLGNEGYGLPEHTISLCDATVKIPMRHGVDSLNVAAASAVLFWVLGSERNRF